jgi:hypothetical protein
MLRQILYVTFGPLQTKRAVNCLRLGLVFANGPEGGASPEEWNEVPITDHYRYRVSGHATVPHSAFRRR